jgi:cell division ATPase FtsA
MNTTTQSAENLAGLFNRLQIRTHAVHPRSTMVPNLLNAIATTGAIVASVTLNSAFNLYCLGRIPFRPRFV